MLFTLTDEQRAFQKIARQFAQDEIPQIERMHMNPNKTLISFEIY